MLNSNWHKVWSDRKVEGDALSLDNLLRLDGYDSGASVLGPVDFLRYAELVADRLRIRDNSSLFEVGCGSGAFLLALAKARKLEVSGLDYSASLVQVARKVFPDRKILEMPADQMPVLPKFDYVISNGVFHYFPLDYARDVFLAMHRKAGTGMAILELPNMHLRDESETARAGILSPEVYRQKYAGYEHTYFLPEWFEALAKEVGATRFEVTEQFIPNYAQAKYRFNVFIDL